MSFGVDHFEHSKGVKYPESNILIMELELLK